jgi:hypothetical protein
VKKLKEEIEIAGQVIGGRVANIMIREKSGRKIELGDLLVVEEDGGYLIMQVYDLGYGSQIPQSIRELAAGLKLEGYGNGLNFLDPQLRNYVMAQVKAVARVTGELVKIPKVLPSFFSSVRYVTREDLKFLTKPDNPVYLGKVRSGSKVLDVGVYLNGDDFFAHHVIIPATTGRGKSNLVKVMLWSIAGQGRFGVLVLDPHDEYFGRSGKGIKDHPEAKRNLSYYSTNPPVGGNTLVVNLGSINPEHFEGIIEFSDAQQHAMRLYHKEFRDRWIEEILKGTQMEGVAQTTLSVLQRILRADLSVYLEKDQIVCKNNVFSNSSGRATISDITKALESGKLVVVDTSKLGDKAELLIGSIIAKEILTKHQEAKAEGKLDEKRTVSIVIEEAPRVLACERLAKLGDNIYSRIAREGRKFKVGLLAITQLVSIIPRDILTNMNTKIILGNEMATERHAIMESAAQDLSTDDRNIASLDKGEAIITSIFTKFAVPIYTPLFEDFIKERVDKFDTKSELIFQG